MNDTGHFFIGHRLIQCTDAYIVGESVNGGWFAMRPVGREWGLVVPRVDQQPSREAALLALRLFDQLCPPRVVH